MQTIDLQIQSRASDGMLSPRELVKLAKEQGIKVVSLTDHDSVDGVEEALMAGGEFGVRVIPGIEISVDEHGSHILGFGLDYKNEKLREKLEEFKQGRIEGARKMVENLKNAGFVLDWEDVLREVTGNTIARPHIAKAVLNRPENKEKLEGIANIHDFIETHLSNDNPNYVHRSAISAKDAIELIHSSSGVAVWSHPAIHFREKYDDLEKFLQDLISWGIDGLEVFNPSHTEDDVESIQGLALQYNLIMTAGSDFHDKGEHQRDPKSGLHSTDTLGDYETYGFSTDDIITKLDEAIKKYSSLS